MLVEKFGSGLFSFHRGKFVPFGFEAADDVSHDASLDSVRFDLLIQDADENATDKRELRTFVCKVQQQYAMSFCDVP